MSQMKYTGAQAIVKSLIEEGVDTIFGYPGGQIMPTYDAIYEFENKGEIRHIRTRHEQGAVHAAQGYARSSGRVGVCIATSGPGATNLITGIADAMMDSTPLICITGQVPAGLLGTDSFQEVDITGVSLPITKWSYQITRAEEIPEIMAKAFFIAKSGRPGVVLIDVAKNAQVDTLDFDYRKIESIRSYTPKPTLDPEQIKAAAEMINSARKPFLIFGQGIILSGAEKQLEAFIDKTGIPSAATLLGLSALPDGNPNFTGMVGMHGNYANNILTNQCDVLVAIGMRFDDRVTGNVSTYARQAKVVHIDLDPAEIGKIIPTDAPVVADAKEALEALLPLVEAKDHRAWRSEFDALQKTEDEIITAPECSPKGGCRLKMAEVISRLAEFTQGDITTVTDVGQHQMKAARYSRYARTRSLITSGGQGTMGFGLPAAIGAKIGTPDRDVVLIVGDGGMQMTIQELGTIMEYRIPVKIVILDNEYLGMVRQWQQLFFGRRYSSTPMTNPDFIKLASAYGIGGEKVERREDLEGAFGRMLGNKNEPYILECAVQCSENVFPMVPPNACVSDVMLGDGVRECVCAHPRH